MSDDEDRIEKYNFIKRIVVYDIGIFLLASVIALWQDFSIWISLSLLGVLFGGIGAFLSGPGSLYNRHDDIDIRRPNENHIKRIASFFTHTSPTYSIENAMMLSGVVAFIVSFPFLWV